MPQRTNDFQELVVLIQKALAPDGAVVTESAMVETGEDGKSREIDVLIDTKVGEYRIKIAVEAKDESRPMDITRFESIIGKYQVEGGVKVNKVVVVTHKGFTESVIDRAKKLDFDLFTLQEATEFDWSQFKPPGPTFKSFLEIKNVKLNLGGGQIDGALPSVRIVCSCGKFHGTASEFAKHCFWQVAMKKNAEELKAADDDASTKQQSKKLAVKVTEGDDANHQRFVVNGEKRERLISSEFEIHFRKPPAFQPHKHNGFSFASHICGVDILPALPMQKGDATVRDSRLVCSCGGKDHGLLMNYVSKQMSDCMKPTSEAQQLLRDAVAKSPNGIAHVLASLRLPKKWRIVRGNITHKADEIRVRVHGQKGDPMEVKQFDLQNVGGDLKRICQFKASVGGKTMSILMPDGLN